MPSPDAQSATASSGSRKTAVVFRTHYCVPEIEARIDKLRKDIAALCEETDVHVLTEVETAIPVRLLNIRTSFDYAEYSAGFTGLIGDKVVPGNCHLPALFFAERYPQYDDYWFVEFDVVYSGNWGRFLNAFREEKADLLASNIRKAEDQPGWTWLPGFNAPDANPQRIAGFFPIYRINKAALAAVRDACARRWVGHFEILMPTAIHAAGLTLSDFGGVGEWTPPERRNRHYLALEATGFDNTTGTMRAYPAIRRPTIPGMLHHPCKPGQRGRLKSIGRGILRAYREAPLATMAYLVTWARLLIIRPLRRW